MQNRTRAQLESDPLPFPWGTVVIDDANERQGHLTAIRGRVAYLRPIGGGKEWTTPASKIRKASNE